MILQDLVNYYEILEADEDSGIPVRGYGKAKVSYALNISKSGELLNIIPLKVPTADGKKMIPQDVLVPAQEGRSSGVKPYFLCDNSSYVLGTDNKGKPERTRRCFEAFRKLTCDILSDVHNEEAEALKNYVNTWDPDNAADNAMIANYIEDIYKGANFVFKLENQNRYINENKEVKLAWEEFLNSTSDEFKGRCIITGMKEPIERLHPAIKGVKGAQISGGLLVSFNASAYESYGNRDSQGLNSSIGKYAAFAYGTVLNRLLADKKHKLQIGDATVVYWAESPDEIYRDTMSLFLDPPQDTEIIEDGYRNDEETAREIQGILSKIALGKPLENTGKIDPRTKFHILGLSPNSSRISVRFYISDSFGGFVEHLQKHYRDMEIEKQSNKDFDKIPIWKMLYETVAPTAKEKSASPLLAGSVMRSVLQGTAYPSILYDAILIRTRADRKMNYERASIIKAYLLRKNGNEAYKEVLKVSLNEKSSNISYVLGRLFAVLEKAQQEANPGINTTIKDKYFNSACATPASIFPRLIKLANYHTSKAEYGYSYDRKIEELMDLIQMDGKPFPTRLTSEEQGIFYLGYYHQRNAFYNKKTKEDYTESEKDSMAE